MISGTNQEYAENFLQDIIDSNRKIILTVADFTLRKPIIISKYIEIVSNHGGRTDIIIGDLQAIPILLR